MGEFLDLNGASAAELSVLLGLQPQAAEALAAAAPFADAADLRARLAAAPDLDSLTVPKLDLNGTTSATLRQLGLSPASASAVMAALPVYDLRTLNALPLTEVEVAAVRRVFQVRPLSYVDKASGQTIDLTPSAKALMVRVDAPEVESAHLTRAMPGLRSAARSGRYRLILAEDAETGSSSLGRLTGQPGVELAAPGFTGPDGELRYLDPQFVVVQFAQGVTAAASDQVLARLDLVPHLRMRTPGLIVARFATGAGSPQRIGQTLMALNGADEVAFAEPAYVGFDDIEAAAEPTQRKRRSKAPQTEGAPPDGLPPPGSGEAETAQGLLDHLAMIGARHVWPGGRGDPSVLVVTVDTGAMTEHPALAGTSPARGGADWNYADDEGGAPKDDHGHGTFVAALAVGRGAQGIWGVAPDCGFVPLKVPLFATIDSYARRRDAILAAAALARAGQRVVVNLSWRTVGDIALIRTAVAEALAAGAIVVASAGNNPAEGGRPHYPSDYAGVISVGAVNAAGARAPYSQWGTETDLAAPGGDGQGGTNLRSAALDGGVRDDWGTSFSAAIVTGAAALAWSRMPGASAAAVVARLLATARAMPGAGLGAGLLDLRAALGQPAAPEPDAPDAPDIAWLDRLSRADLVDRFGILPFVARLILSRRPYRDWEALRRTLGLTAAQYAALRAAALAQADPAPA